MTIMAGKPTQPATHIVTTPQDALPQVSYALATIISKNDQSQTEPHDVILYAAHATGTIPAFADSSASDHCFVNRKVFTKYTLYASFKEGQATSKNAVFCILGQGMVKKVVKMGSRCVEPSQQT